MKTVAVFMILGGMFAGAGRLDATAAQQRSARPAPAVKPVQPAPSTPAAGSKPLTNDDIVQMVQGGLGESVVVAAIRTAKATEFDVSPMSLLALKKNGVSDNIVSVMIDPKAAITAAAPSAAVALPGSPTLNTDTRARIDSATAAPEIPREPGIYWDKGQDGNYNLLALEPTVFSQGKSGGFFTSALTYGIKKIQIKAVTRGSAAALHIDQNKPTFYFYFEGKGSGLAGGGLSGWMAAATSPNEFILARMTSRKSERELVVGEANFLGGSAGTRGKDTVDLKIDRLSGGIYRVSPLTSLEPGEYCFFYAGGLSALATGPYATGAANGKLFDFGIYEAK